jgi:hypothetical protein
MEWIGWLSPGLLLATIVYQVARHLSAHDNGGVSRFLYVGQVGASCGFLFYSWTIDNWVFVVTNVLLVGAATCGILIHRRHARRAATR